MQRDPIRPIVYDTGALIAAERYSRRFGLLHSQAAEDGRPIVIPAPVLTQAWRGSASQARLARLIKGCVIRPTGMVTAMAAGVLLGRSGTSDAIDAIVVATALRLRAAVVTSDPKDLAHLAEYAPEGERLALVPL